MKDIVDYEDAIKETRQRTAQVMLATGFRPSKRLRGNRPRTEAELEALCDAVIYAVEEARKSGLIVKTENGYTMTW